MSKKLILVILYVALFEVFPLAVYAQERQFAVLSESSGIGIVKADEQYFRIDNGIWGPNWSWTSYRGNVVVEAGKSISRLETTLRQTGAKLNLDVTTEQTTPRQLSIHYRLKSSKDTQLTLAIVSLSFSNLFADAAKVIAKSLNNTTQTRSFPLGLGSFDEPVSQLEFTDKNGLKTNIQINPPTKISIDNSLRIILAEQQIKAVSIKEVKLIVNLPDIATYYASPDQIPFDEGFDTWFPWEPRQDYDLPTEIDMSDWLQAPAGKHGRILRKNDKLIYNGKPIKLWGLNLCYSSCAPEKSLSEKRARFYSKYGINSVRLHKYADGPGWQGIQGQDSFLDFDPEALDRMDYQVAQFKKRGIYTKLSSTFGVKLGPKDRQLVPYMDEFGKLSGNQKRLSTGLGSVFLSREIQDMQIKQIVKLLEHKNPYTGLTYAEDPAIVVVELFNEDSVLFFGTLRILQTIPTLRQRSTRQFSEWLVNRYGGENALIAAWGKDALTSFGNEGITGESLSKKTIVPAGNPWFYDPMQLDGSQKHKRARMYDTMQFLYELQNDFYSRYVAAIRATGYKGEILGSNWQAGRDVSHYYNLHSDYLVGLIDRHNYFGGRSGDSINNISMCRIPGSALLSIGMQQVADRPFMLSEWIHVFPNEWGVEGPAIIGAYAMGLQGWDVSYMFQNRDSAGFSSTIGRDQWDVTAPQVLGIFPAVARQVLRGDVKESDIQATRYVHVPSLRNGKLGFEDKVIHEHDIKTFDSDKVPFRTLSVVRCVVEFTDQYLQTPVFDISPYFTNGVYQSSTGQLRWKEGDSRHSGYFTINTAATKAIVGFAKGQTIRLDNVTIRPKSRFAAIYITAKEKDKDLASSSKLIVVALARARNTDMKIFRDTRLLSKGTSPVLMEPVHAEITVSRDGSPKVFALDHDGRKTDVTMPISNSTFEIDGARYKTIYYEIEY
jgi:hypothetical protein